MGRYFNELKRSMNWLGNKPDTIFLGQAVEADGTAMSGTLKDISINKRLELPVFEELQLGMSIGMSLNGTVPISIYPRFNFLALATNQLVNHLDKIKVFSHGDFNPKVIIRTSIGSERPLHPQSQHVGDFTNAYRLLCSTINIIKLDDPEQIFPAYKEAYESDGSFIIVEWGDYYNEK